MWYSKCAILYNNAQIVYFGKSIAREKWKIW